MVGSGALIEIDPTNVAIAQRHIARLGLALSVVEADAGTTDAYAGLVPADLVILSGIMGNMSAADIERLVHVSRQQRRSSGLAARRTPTSDPTSADGSARRGSRNCPARSGSKALECGSA